MSLTLSNQIKSNQISDITHYVQLNVFCPGGRMLQTIMKNIGEMSDPVNR